MSEDRQAARDGQEQPLTQTGAATPPSAGARSPGRRAFLVGTGGLAAAALVGGGGRWLSEQVTSAGPAATKPRASGSGSGLDLEARRARALQLRITTAQQQLREPFPPTPTQRRRGPLRGRWAGQLHQGPASQRPRRGRP